ncbi:hypothetical protein BDV06DRAFT_229369 [Aspergillus oleicola]
MISPKPSTRTISQATGPSLYFASQHFISLPHSNYDSRIPCAAAVEPPHSTIYKLRPKPTSLELSRLSGSLDFHEESGRCPPRSRSVRGLPRHALTGLLAGALPKGTVQYGHKLLSATVISTNEVELDFGPKGKATYDLVISADGVWSRVRNALTDEKPYYTVTQLITGTIPSISSRYPRLTELRSNHSTPSHQTLPSLITKTNITLIGDAAHLMLPWAGEGVNLAMWDSLLLSRAIASAFQQSQNEKAPFLTALDSLLRRFEEDMFSRAGEKADETKGNGEMMFGEDGAANFKAFFESAYGPRDGSGDGGGYQYIG